MNVSRPLDRGYREFFMHPPSKQLDGLTRGVLAVALATAMNACGGKDTVPDTSAPAHDVADLG